MSSSGNGSTGTSFGRTSKCRWKLSALLVPLLPTNPRSRPARHAIADVQPVAIVGHVEVLVRRVRLRHEQGPSPPGCSRVGVPLDEFAVRHGENRVTALRGEDVETLVSAAVAEVVEHVDVRRWQWDPEREHQLARRRWNRRGVRGDSRHRHGRRGGRGRGEPHPPGGGEGGAGIVEAAGSRRRAAPRPNASPTAMAPAVAASAARALRRVSRRGVGTSWSNMRMWCDLRVVDGRPSGQQQGPRQRRRRTGREHRTISSSFRHQAVTPDPAALRLRVTYRQDEHKITQIPVTTDT